MKTGEKIKGLRITKGMQIIVDKVYNENYCVMLKKENIQYALTPKKNKQTQILTILDSKIVKGYNTGNGRSFKQYIIELTTQEIGLVHIYSTQNFILA